MDEYSAKQTSNDLTEKYLLDKAKDPQTFINRLSRCPKTLQYKIMCNSTFDSKNNCDA